jgi:hypothetical protein
MIRRSLIALAFGLACSIGGAANAATLFATYTGTVSKGVDVQGLFGAAGADLTGDAFSATYTIDTDLGPVFPFTGGVQGAPAGTGVLAGTVSPIISASLNIAGITYTSQNFGYSGYFAYLDGFYPDATLGYQYNFATSVQLGVNQPIGVLNMQAFGTPADGVVTGAAPLTGFELPNNTDSRGLFTSAEDILQFSVQTFFFDGPVYIAVPEPDVWSLLILGFGGMGLALRRRYRWAV